MGLRAKQTELDLRPCGFLVALSSSSAVCCVLNREILDKVIGKKVECVWLIHISA